MWAAAGLCAGCVHAAVLCRAWRRSACLSFVRSAPDAASPRHMPLTPPNAGRCCAATPPPTHTRWRSCRARRRSWASIWTPRGRVGGQGRLSSSAWFGLQPPRLLCESARPATQLRAAPRLTLLHAPRAASASASTSALPRRLAAAVAERAARVRSHRPRSPGSHHAAGDQAHAERPLLLHRRDARRVLLAPLCPGRHTLYALHLPHPVRCRLVMRHQRRRPPLLSCRWSRLPSSPCPPPPLPAQPLPRHHCAPPDGGAAGSAGQQGAAHGTARVCGAPGLGQGESVGQAVLEAGRPPTPQVVAQRCCRCCEQVPSADGMSPAACLLLLATRLQAVPYT